MHAQTRFVFAVATAIVLSSCSSSAQDDTEPVPEPFSFAILADSHVQGDVEREQRLAAAVDWLNSNSEARAIELVLILGDIGWSTGLPSAKEQLDRLVVPYVPITGDNEIHAGDEQTFYEVFRPHYTELESTLKSWRQAPAPVPNLETAEQSWFTNVSFVHRGVHFIGLDWSARGISGLLGEVGYIHDFEGGTLPWLDATLQATSSNRQDSIVMFSHIPMYWGVFFEAREFNAIASVVAPHAREVYANFAGHTHTTYEESAADGAWDVFVTNAVFDDEIAVRVVDVALDADDFTFAHEIVTVD